MDERQIIRELAYEIWEIEGRPEGRAVEHWVRAERRILLNGAGEAEGHPQPQFDTDESDQEGIRAAREYGQGVKSTENSGQVDSKAAEA
jgi:Protein of unknown function (DUF2934)